jgi:hypothetical protein
MVVLLVWNWVLKMAVRKVEMMVEMLVILMDA